MSILVIADHDNKQLSPATLSAVSAALKIDSAVDVLVAGDNCQAVADLASQIQGVSKVKHADSVLYQYHLPEAVAPLVVSMADGYSHILMIASTNGKNCLPRIAALLDVQAISDVIAVIDKDTFKRPIYAGNVIATVKSSDSVKCMTVRATAFDAVSGEGGQASIEPLAAVGDNSLSSFVKEELAVSDRPELTAASTVVSGGRGVKDKENFELIYQLADKLGAAVGASRAAVDAGFVPNDMQVGQTGKIVAPDLYIAVGISGAIQHLAGMKGSKVIVAINSDEDAPIFQVADYGLVGDLFAVVPEMIEKL